MARRKTPKKTKQKPIRGRRKAALPALLIAFLLAIGGIFGWMWVQAHITHLKKADLYLADLPSAFDGTTVLYISDVNIRNAADSTAVSSMMKKLKRLNADMLVLGGDYSAATGMETLNGVDNMDSTKPAAFIESLYDFHAPLGKFAVAGENDDAEDLSPLFAASGVQLLTDSCVQVEKNGSEIIIAGLSDESTGKTPYEKIGSYFSGDECVIAVAHNPASYVGIRVAEARGGGAWADAVLSGHTLGGQIRIGERTLRNMPEAEKRCIAGWYYQDDLPMLVSQGLGCKGMQLRFGSESEIWLITLRKPTSEKYVLPNFDV